MTLDLKFTGDIFYWRGPAPFFFVTVPEKESAQIKGVAGMVTYGWGVIPVQVQIGETKFKTSLFPKDDKYLVPIKLDVRQREGLEQGDSVSLELEIQL